jgi:DNA-binding CsgD family transcriptional regulator
MAAGADIVRFTQSLAAAESLEQLELAFMAGFPSVLPAERYGFTLSYPEPWLARASVSDTVVEDVVEVPIPGCGSLHLGGGPEYGDEELALATAIAAVVAETVAGIAARRDVARQRDHAVMALDLAGTAVVTTGPERRLNDAARRLLAEVVDGERRLDEMFARQVGRLEVELASGDAAIIHARASRTEDGLVVVLELEREPGLAPGPLAALTPREQEVATLVVDGLADREIAERLCLSHHTVTQYVKRIYRKIEVDSRVGLTRVLLTTRR